MMKPFYWDKSVYYESYNYTLSQMEKIPNYNVSRLSNNVWNPKIAYDGDDTVYIMEGIISASPGTQRYVYKFSLSSKTYSAWSLPATYQNHCNADIIYCNGAIYLFGGTYGASTPTYLNTIFKYTIATGSWANLGALLPTAAIELSLCINGTDIYFWSGNQGSQATATLTAGKFNTLNNAVTMLTNVPGINGNSSNGLVLGALAHDGKNLYACMVMRTGGTYGAIYRLDNTIWTSVYAGAAYASAYYGGMPIIKGNNIYFVGGVLQGGLTATPYGRVLRLNNGQFLQWGSNTSGTVRLSGNRLCFEDKNENIWSFFATDTSLAAPAKIHTKVSTTYGFNNTSALWELKKDIKVYSDPPNFTTSTGFNFGSPATPTTLITDKIITFGDMVTPTEKVTLMIGEEQ